MKIKNIFNLIKNVIYLYVNMSKNGGDFIKKLLPSQKKWLKTKNKKQIRKLQKRNKCNRIRILHNTPHHCHNNTLIIKAPKVFSVVENPEETMRCFYEIIKDTSYKEFDKRYYFDWSEVEEVSIDAIMYVIAIVKNMKTSELFRYQFYGNQPKNQDVRDLLDECGFYHYVSQKSRRINTQKNTITIKSGKKVDSDVAKEICKFVNNKCNTTKRFTQSLYTILIELMDNVVQHAYTELQSTTFSRWYVFVEDNEEYIKFTFLDTGSGIPNTINKRIAENALRFVHLKTDSSLLLSALRGEFRTSTQSTNRGKGLPEILKYGYNVFVNRFMIFSGKGSCVIINEKDIRLKDYNNKTFGTLCYWEIDKNMIDERDRNGNNKN